MDVRRKQNFGLVTFTVTRTKTVRQRVDGVVMDVLNTSFRSPVGDITADAMVILGCAGGKTNEHGDFWLGRYYSFYRMLFASDL